MPAITSTARTSIIARVRICSWARWPAAAGQGDREDFDATDDPVHGQQQLAFFSGFYGNHIYLPLLCYDGDTGDLIGVALQPGNAAPSAKLMPMKGPASAPLVGADRVRAHLTSQRSLQIATP